jgi:GDP-L-fucose synthase
MTRSDDVNNLRVLVTGATGFLGNRLVTELARSGARVYPVSRRLGYDLRDRAEAYRALLDSKAEAVVHLAARVGGIGANAANPDIFFTDNMRMGMNVVEATASAGARLTLLSTVCAYPKHCPVPFREEEFWNGYPEETNAPYGVAKRSLLVMCSAYGAKRGLRYAYLVPCNLYGPGDNFDPGSSHVIPALVQKFSDAVDSGRDSVTLWGTGKATRSFLYVDDAASAIVRAVATGLDHDGPINLPGSEEITIENLASIIGSLVGFRGALFWDPMKPDGQPRRAIDGSRAKDLLAWEPSTKLEEGLRRTVEWWSSRKTAVAAQT